MAALAEAELWIRNRREKRLSALYAGSRSRSEPAFNLRRSEWLLSAQPISVEGVSLVVRRYVSTRRHSLTSDAYSLFDRQRFSHAISLRS